ncbi:MAG: alpha-E domain-containing protein, partial [Verrucomicrobia bacterium]|nr:alpha-E domain-containing protein [Cytophagales bacterium]
MLSRIASNLFWMGRYLERAEHLSQYIKIQYLSSLDAPLSYNKETALDSILYMSGNQEDYHLCHEQIDDDDVLFYTTFDERNTLSLKNCIRMARENARGGRDELASEAWQAINRLYHYTNNFSASNFSQEKRYDFYQSISDNTYIIKG